MALRAIRINDDPILKKHCKKVEVVDNKIRQILNDMLQRIFQIQAWCNINEAGICDVSINGITHK